MKQPPASLARRPSAQDELAMMQARAEYLRQHPKELEALAVKMGIHDKKGNLTKAYGG